jgi:hypothetical protein
MGLGAYFDGANDQGVRLRESQPIVMRFNPDVGHCSAKNMQAIVLESTTL